MTLRTMSTTSRMCSNGLPYGMPKNPSLQERTLQPRPRVNRPPLTRSMSMAAIAVSKGLRTNASAMPEARRTLLVTPAAVASGIKGGPYTWGANSPSSPASSSIFACPVRTGPGTAGVTTPQ